MFSEAVLVLSEAVLSGAVLVLDRLFEGPLGCTARRFEYEYEHRPQAA